MGRKIIMKIQILAVYNTIAEKGGEINMTTKDRIIEGKQERQHTMDKLSVKNSQAYTYDKENGTGCRESAKKTTRSSERKEDR
jgi:hypothetical protein